MGCLENEGEILGVPAISEGGRGVRVGIDLTLGKDEGADVCPVACVGVLMNTEGDRLGVSVKREGPCDGTSLVGR